MGIRTIPQLDAAEARRQVAANEEEIRRSFLDKHPELDVIANWTLITRTIGASLTVENAERLVEGNKTSFAVLSPEELAADQVRWADTICVSQFQKQFKPYEAESWSKKLYDMARERRHRYVVQLPRMEAKDLVDREKARPAILAAKKASRPAYDPATILGGRAAYDQTIATELETFASMDIEQLEKIGAQLRAVDARKNGNTATLRAEVKADYESRHPESVGSSPVRPEDVKRFNERSQQVENRDNPDGVVIGYTAQELKSMALGEYRRLFMRNNGGSWFYKPGVEEAINKVLSGQLTEPARIRSEFQRTHIVA